MALSRFWTFILILSIGYVLVMLAAGRQHSLGTLVNGNQGDPMLVAEKDSADLHGTGLLVELRAAGENGVMRGDTLITLGKGGMVRYTHGTQAADGLFEPYGDHTNIILKRMISDVIANYEPRAELLDVIINASPDNNALFVSIQYKIRNSIQPYVLNLVLERTR